MPTTELPVAELDIRPIESTDQEAPATSPPNEEVDRADAPSEPHTVPDFATLIRDAMSRLGPKTAVVIDLSVRRGLGDAEVGAVVGIREEIVSETIARTRERVERALSIFVLVKTRVNVCPDLRRVVGAHARPSLDPLTADVVGAHLDDCVGCSHAWSQIPPPLEVLRRLPADPPTRRRRDRIREHIRHWAGREGSGSRIRLIHAASAGVALALVIGIVTAMSGTGQAVDDEPVGIEVAESPRIENVRQSQTPTTTTGIARPTTTDAARAKPAPAPVVPTTVVPSEPPLVKIITPFNRQVFATTSGLSPIDLVAVVQDDIDEGLQVDWYEGSNYLGTGNAITATTPGGCADTVTYTVSATVKDSSANTTIETVTFTVRCKKPGS